MCGILGSCLGGEGSYYVPQGQESTITWADRGQICVFNWAEIPGFVLDQK